MIKHLTEQDFMKATMCRICHPEEGKSGIVKVSIPRSIRFNYDLLNKYEYNICPGTKTHLLFKRWVDNFSLSLEKRIIMDAIIYKDTTIKAKQLALPGI